MAEQKRNLSFWTGIKNAFKSRLIRDIIIFVLLTSAVFCGLTLDVSNGMRLRHLDFLSHGFINWLIGFIGITKIEVSLPAWMLFACLLSVGFVFLLGDIVKPIFNHFFYKQTGDETADKKANKKFSLIYFLLVFVLSALIVGLFAIRGAFSVPSIDYIVFGDLFILSLLTGLLTFIGICLVIALINGLIIFISYLASKISEKTKNYKNAIAKDNGELKDSEKLFPSLTAIDEIGEQEKTVSSEVSLTDLALRFQSYAINNHKIYYELPLLRSFIAGMAATRLIILEGLSGTGKSMLPRMFTQFTNSNASFTPVQATWRDKTDILGFYSEFTKTFKSTDFLRNLYTASYNDKINTMVLDEINLSRIEYYFADFLSILEYPAEDWKIKIFEAQKDQQLPRKLENGYIKIPENTWFVGTANTDDSTFTITDKVYDRAIIIDFAEKISPIKSSYPSDPISLSAEKLQEMLDQAAANPEFRLNDADLDKFISICDFTKDAFDIRFGNRIMVQIEEFVPVYVALGGTKEEALDFMFARKILRKLHGAYEDYVKDELVKLTKLINETYGKGVFKETERLIAKIIKRLV